MSEKKRPDTRVVLKPIEGGPTITVCSYWTDTGRPSGGLDRRIAKMVLHLRPDERTGEPARTVEVSNAPGARNYYCNLYADAPKRDDWSASYEPRSSSKREPPPDVDADDIPF